MDSPHLTVIVPTCNRSDLLEKCLSKLSPEFQSLDSANYAVIVSDDGNSGDSRVLIDQRYRWAKWIKGPSRGPGANRNHAINFATTEWIVFIDDDCLPVPGLLRNYLRLVQEIPSGANAVLMGATIRTNKLKSLKYEAPHNPEAGIGITANFAITKKLYQASGCIDERFRYSMEDVEFFARLRAMGCHFISAKEAIVYHPLRERPAPRTVALRWESMAINGHDHGASGFTIAWRLPWHAARVIQSRFRGQERSLENLIVAFSFLREWIWTVVYTPFWAIKCSKMERNAFWANEEEKRGRTPKYGF